MSALRVVHVLFCLFVLHLKTAFSGPMEVSGRYQKGNSIEQNDWRHVLSSIESRLKSLDFLYTSQLTPTLEARLEHFQNRISGMEVKLLRVETLLTSKLDRMSDNISSRHFRDDMVQTDMFRKIETAYDGITHRLAYMDRKWENGFVKMQEKSEALSKKLETVNNALTDKYDSIESQLTDLVDGMEDISTSFHNSGFKITKASEKPVNHTHQEQHEMHDISRSSLQQDLINEVKQICGNSTESLQLLRSELHDFTQSNSTEKSFDSFSDYFEKMLNEYASKVSDLGAQVSKSDYKIASHLSMIEKVVNSSRSEMQNGLRALMVQVGKQSPKSNIQYEVIDQKLLSDMAQKLDSNFDKVIATQNTFLESCHRLQMDESQLEGQISDILNKLIDNFEGTTREHHHVLRKIEGLLVKHDIHNKKELHQANANIMTVYELLKKESKEMKDKYKQTTDNLEALFALVQNIMGSGGSGIIKRDINKEVIEYIQSLEKALNFTKHQQMKMFDSYKVTIETLLTMSQTKQEDENFMILLMKNSTESMSLLLKQFEMFSERFNENFKTEILNDVGKIFELVKKNSENLSRISDPASHLDIDKNNKSTEVKTKQEEINNKNINAKASNNGKDLDSLIREIFFVNNGTELKTSSTTQDPSLDVDIDVRFDIGGDSNNEKSVHNSSNANILNSSQEANERDATDCLEVLIDPRYDQIQTNKNGKKLCNRKNQERNSTNNFDKPHIYTITEQSTIERNVLIPEMISFPNKTKNVDTHKI